MIVVRRSSSKVNKLQRNFLSISSTLMSASPLPASNGTGTGACGGGQSQSFDFSYILSSENKAKAIKLLTTDRENCTFQIPSDDKSYRKAAVLVPLCYDMNGKPSLLYNLRSDNLSKHKSEISFPGGSLDPEDNNDPVKAALRETHEELGIPRDEIEVWTTLRLFPTVYSKMGVIPVLGYFKNGPLNPSALKINPHEVDHAFTISLEHLCNPYNWEDGPIRKFKGADFNMPMWKNLNVYIGSEEIHLWGLTAFVTHIALSALLPGEVYERKLPYLYLELKSDTKKPSDSTPKL